ncbi:MAG TPA: amino acid permease [Bryobacteraceae bacterium]|nr:amino acid permease [Bryobacteraceae bacterium]
MTPTASTVTLVRQLGVVSATALVVSNMIGTGIFTTSGYLAGDLGDPSLFLLIWAVGAIAALTGSFCFSELGVNFPASGGEYVYLTRAYGPAWGFITGWVSFFAGFSAPIAVAALAFSDYLGYFSPALKQANAPALFGSGEWTFKLGGAQMAASALIVVFTILNVFGIQRVAKIQNVLTAIKVAVVVAFVALGFFIGSGDWSHFSQKAVRTSSTPLFQQFAISLFWIYVSYSGWNAATYVAEEIKQPGKTLPKALTFGTMLVAGLYILLNMVFLYAAPLEEMKGVLAIGSLAASKLFGPEIAGAFSLLMALSIMSSVSAMVTIGPRVYYAMAKNGAFFDSAAKVHEKYRTPVIAILAQGLCASIMTLTPFPQLFFYIGMTLNFTAAMAVASILVFRRRRPDWQKIGVVSFAYPLVPMTFILMAAWMTLYGITQQTRVSLLAIGTILAGALVYHFKIAKQVKEIQ